MDEMKLLSKQRVTFSSDIEEYDDDEAVETAEDGEISGQENDEEIEEIEEAFERNEERSLSENEVDIDVDGSSDNETIISCPDVESPTHAVCVNQIDVDGGAERQEANNTPIEAAVVPEADESKKIHPKKAPKSGQAPKSDSKTRTQQNQLLKIHLNVRKCCELRYLENDRLPRYNGYISQYGLSKDQLDALEHSKRAHRQHLDEKRRQYRDAIARKSAENEQAFARWLRHKQKNSKSRTKNMYDSK